MDQSRDGDSGMEGRHLQGERQLLPRADLFPGNPSAPVGSGSFGETWGPSALAANAWAHLAATYDKQTLRLYVNGVQVSNRSHDKHRNLDKSLQIGGDSIHGQFFQESSTRSASTTLPPTAAQIQADMAVEVGLIPIRIWVKAELSRSRFSDNFLVA